MTRRTTFVFLLALAVPAIAAAQTDTCLDANTQTFDAWLNCRIEHVLAAAGGPAGSEKQAETPSVSQDSPSLVDTTSASDFVGFGLTLLGLRNAPANSSDVTSGATSITATAFALLAAAYGKDPLADSDFYYGHPNWRRVSFTAGRQPVREDGQGFNAEATIELMHTAAEQRSVLALFPELGLSAYSCDDLFHQRALLDAVLDGSDQLLA